VQKRRIKILFIDDNEPNNVLTQAIIDAEELLIDSSFSQSIDEAIEILHSFEKEDSFPELIFCDIKLPIKDGYDFAEYYSTHFYENHKKVRMYFMSADFQPEDFDKLTQYPFVFNVYIKPFSREIFDDAKDNKDDSDDETDDDENIDNDEDNSEVPV